MAIYLSVVIPIYNEEKRIGQTLEAVRAYLDRQSYTYEVILVDDGSTDATRAIANRIIQGLPAYQLLVNSSNRGKGAVVKQGILAAQGEFVLFIDADNSTPIEQIEKLLPYADDYQIVFGSRHVKEAKILVPQALHRAWLSRMSNLLIRWILLPGICDTQCGFKLFQQKAAKEIFSRVTIDRFGFDFEALAIAKILGYKYKEVGIDWYNEGASKVRAGQDAIRTLKDLFQVKLNLRRGIYNQPVDLVSTVLPIGVAGAPAEKELVEKISN